MITLKCVLNDLRKYHAITEDDASYDALAAHALMRAIKEEEDACELMGLPHRTLDSVHERAAAILRQSLEETDP